MQDKIFKGLFDTTSTTSIAAWQFIVCVAVSLVIGFILVFAYTFKNKSSKSFVVTLSLIPAVVCVVIMMVNGNIGAGVAVAGTFSLVRFRSVPGTAKEIGAIFIAMGAGLAAGMGYLGYALLFTVILGGMLMIYTVSGFGKNAVIGSDKTMRITIPENLDYTGVFDDLLSEYTSKYEVVSVKTTNLGSLFKLTYNITLKDPAKEKQFIDKLRCRNGNLEISVSKQETATMEL